MSRGSEEPAADYGIAARRVDEHGSLRLLAWGGPPAGKPEMMKFLDKILRRNRGGHDQWLIDHPGKDSMSVPTPALNASYDQASREKMERELAEQKAKMNK